MTVTEFLLYLILTLVSVAFYLIRRSYSYWSSLGVPHDSPHIFYGNLIGYRKTTSIHELFRKCYLKYKHVTPFFGFYKMTAPVAVITNLDLAKNIIIKDFQSFSDRYIFYNEKDDPLTSNIFTIHGPKWKSIRHKITPTFTTGKMKFMFPTIVDVCNDMTSTLINQAKNGTAMIEFAELLACYTTDVIGKCAFGLECNSLKNPHAEFRKFGHKIFGEDRNCEVITLIIQVFPRLARRLRLRQYPDDLHNFFMSVTKDTIDYREKNKMKRNDFIDILVEMKNNMDDHFSLEDAAAEIFLFFANGFEPSASTMANCLYELALNDDLQTALRCEIQNCIEDNGGEVTYELIGEMPLLDRVFKEALRKYSIFPYLSRIAESDYKVPGSDIFIQKGVEVIVPVDAIHHDPSIYHDPHTFDPDRFLSEAIEKRHPMAYLPFGDGPRACIGLRFALLHAKIGLIALINSLKFLTCEKTEKDIKLGEKNFMLTPKNGIFLSVESL